MRVLLDESLPRQLARLLPEHDVRTVAAMGWTGIRNGDLLKLAVGGFDAFLTADQNLEHQQNLGALPIAVVVLMAPAGTVDKFQGREAAVVLYSMATSSADDVPRSLEFLSHAIGSTSRCPRAMCLAYVVASPRLLESRARTIEQMRLANALCRFVEIAESGS